VETLYKGFTSPLPNQRPKTQDPSPPARRPSFDRITSPRCSLCPPNINHHNATDDFPPCFLNPPPSTSLPLLAHCLRVAVYHHRPSAPRCRDQHQRAQSNSAHSLTFVTTRLRQLATFATATFISLPACYSIDNPEKSSTLIILLHCTTAQVQLTRLCVPSPSCTTVANLRAEKYTNHVDTLVRNH
jgi:hypothetical protein